MYLDIPSLGFSLNISREHGMADLTDEEEDLIDANPDLLDQLVKPGPIYISGWNKPKDCYVSELPDNLAQEFANALDCHVLVYPGRSNVDAPDPEPIARIIPQSNKRKL